MEGMDRPRGPTVVSKMAGFDSLIWLAQASQQRYTNISTYNSRHLSYPTPFAAAAAISTDLTSSGGRRSHRTYASPTTTFVPAPAEKGLGGFMTDFLMGGVAAAVSKTAAAPIERVKLLIQNQDEMLKSGRLSHPYQGVRECFARTVRDEGAISLWRGNVANVVRYFPTQASTPCKRTRRNASMLPLVSIIIY